MTQQDSKISESWRIEHLKSPIDGTKIRYGIWSGAQEAKKGLLFLNGRSEWIEKYSDLPLEMNLGSDVMWATLDHRGQGGSEGPRAHVDDYDSFARDAAAVAKASFGDRPYLIVTHSMGGLVALVGLSKGWLHAKAAVLCSPLLALPDSPLPRSVARPIAHLLFHTPFRMRSTGVKGKRDMVFASNTLTHSKENFQKILASPYPYTPPTFGWVHASFVACEEVFRDANMRRMATAVKIIYGGEEEVVDSTVYPAWCDSLRNVSGKPVELTKLPEGRHELLNESDPWRLQAVSLAQLWLKQYG